MSRSWGIGAIALLVPVVAPAAPAAPADGVALSAPADPTPRQSLAVEALDGSVVTAAGTFAGWSDYARSRFFAEHGGRCGTGGPGFTPAKAGGEPGDCTLSQTVPADAYDPATGGYRIPVVVHVIQNASGSGFVSLARVQSQIDILNEDFRALAGSNGAPGDDTRIEFFLAETGPQGAPTSGVTYTVNNTWFNDVGNYWEELSWDPRRFLNLYTNTAGGDLGYVPDLPQAEVAGAADDRVVIHYSAFGRDAPIGPPFHQGRTATHEIGHFLGLEHTFEGGCAGAAGCYVSGDLICDTNPQQSPTEGCFGGVSCGSLDPSDNYMDYSDDLCMQRFTPEQARRMRCTLEHYRGTLLLPSAESCGNGTLQPGEQCDDGNREPGDGCDATCRRESRMDHDCCEVGHGAGCSEPAIRDCVCAEQPLCCSDGWDAGCVEAVEASGCGSCTVAPVEVSAPGSTEPLLFVDRGTLAWEGPAANGAERFHVYRGGFDTLPGGAYGACFAAGVSASSLQTTEAPGPGQGWFFLVSGVNSAGEGPLGRSSAGIARLATQPCP